MKPRFVMAALIIWSQAKCFPRDGECTILIHFPGSLRARRFEKSTDVCPNVRNGSRSPQWCGARWCTQDTVHKCFVNSTEVVLAGEIMMARKVRMSFMAMPFFGIDVAGMKRQHRKVFLPAYWLTQKIWHVKEHLVGSIPVLLQ